MKAEDFIRKSIFDEYQGKRYSVIDSGEIADETVTYWKRNSFADKGNVFKALTKQAKEIAKRYTRAVK